MSEISTAEKYSQPEVVTCWQNLSKQGLQKCEQEMISRYFPATGRLLDVGCGAGRAVLALNQAGYTVSGIDLSLPMLLAGRALSAEAQFSAANLLALPFANNAFTAVFMFFGALQHIPGRARRRQAMAELARVTQPGGRLILGLDNLAPALSCYVYWLLEKVCRPARASGSNHARQPSAADATLWSRETRRVHPLVWHARGLARTLRWRTWPGWVDLARQFYPNGAEPGDAQVAQFSLQSTPGLVYYHLYRADEVAADAANAGWRLLGHHSGTELNENRLYPSYIRRQDKQQFFAFEK
ncbi:MAG: class I SAM-dependent methyltransferase [Anaerolineales bacterium]|nr:class I SAM-dependent methyltransferase [Anaerolineales bacterium]